jgi:hypothetical protein
MAGLQTGDTGGGLLAVRACASHRLSIHRSQNAGRHCHQSQQDLSRSHTFHQIKQPQPAEQKRDFRLQTSSGFGPGGLRRSATGGHSAVPSSAVQVARPDRGQP